MATCLMVRCSQMIVLSDSLKKNSLSAIERLYVLQKAFFVVESVEILNHILFNHTCIVGLNFGDLFPNSYGVVFFVVSR